MSDKHQYEQPVYHNGPQENEETAVKVPHEPQNIGQEDDAQEDNQPESQNDAEQVKNNEDNVKDEKIEPEISSKENIDSENIQVVENQAPADDQAHHQVPKSDKNDADIVPSGSKNLRPIVRVVDNRIELNKEPEKSDIPEDQIKKQEEMLKRNNTVDTNEEITPLADTEVMKNQTEDEYYKVDQGPHRVENRRQVMNKPRPATRAGGDGARIQKNILIKKKKRRLKSGAKKSKRWNERFYIPNKEFGYTQDVFSKVAQDKILRGPTSSSKRPMSKFDKNRVSSGKQSREFSNTNYLNKFSREFPTPTQNIRSLNKNNYIKELKWNDRFNVTSSK